jgi:hypothetical protein
MSSISAKRMVTCDLRLGPNVFVDNPASIATQFRRGLSPGVARRLREHIDSNIDQRIRVVVQSVGFPPLE